MSYIEFVKLFGVVALGLALYGLSRGLTYRVQEALKGDEPPPKKEEE